MQDIDCLEGEVIEASQHLKQLEAQVAAKWVGIVDAHAREETDSLGCRRQQHSQGEDSRT